LDLTRGNYYFECIWNNWNPGPFIAQARAMLLTVPNVTAVTSFSLTRQTVVNPITKLMEQQAVYAATIENTFTDAALSISGILPGAPST
jgi:hypothetical protein